MTPFNQLLSLDFPLAPGRWADVFFDGEAFEMEDERLWTDASYKIFCSPRSLPDPAEIHAGTRIDQTLTLTIQGPRITAPAEIPQPASVRLAFPTTSDWQPLPGLGLGAASHAQPLGMREIERLKALHLSHLRVDLQLAMPAYPAHLRRVSAEAAALGVGLEIALHISAEDAEIQLSVFRALLQNEPLPASVCRWLVYPRPEILAGGSPTEIVLRAAHKFLADATQRPLLRRARTLISSSSNARPSPVS